MLIWGEKVKSLKLEKNCHIFFLFIDFFSKYILNVTHKNVDKKNLKLHLNKKEEIKLIEDKNLEK